MPRLTLPGARSLAPRLSFTPHKAPPLPRGPPAGKRQPRHLSSPSAPESAFLEQKPGTPPVPPSPAQRPQGPCSCRDGPLHWGSGFQAAAGALQLTPGHVDKVFPTLFPRGLPQVCVSQPTSCPETLLPGGASPPMPPAGRMQARGTWHTERAPRALLPCRGGALVDHLPLCPQHSERAGQGGSARALGALESVAEGPQEETAESSGPT